MDGITGRIATFAKRNGSDEGVSPAVKIDENLTNLISFEIYVCRYACLTKGGRPKVRVLNTGWHSRNKFGIVANL
jgi:hypothetical protein